MFRWCFAVCAALVLTAGVFADEKFRVYNETDVELKVVIFHATKPMIYWRETLDVNEKKPTPVGAQTLDDGNRILVVSDAITGKVYLTDTFTTVPGGGRRIKLIGTTPNIRQTTTLIPPPAKDFKE